MSMTAATAISAQQQQQQQPLVFLGGTVGENHWREEQVIPALLGQGIPAAWLFNPVVADWNEQAQRREDAAKRAATYLLFVIANPGTPGNEVSAYSLVETVMALYDQPERVVVALDATRLSPPVAKAMRKAFADLSARFPQAPIFAEIGEATSFLASRLRPLLAGVPRAH